MLTKPISRRSLLGLSAAGAASLMLGGCSETRSDGKTEVEFVSYKREAVSIFEALMAEFNESNDHIYLNFTSPNDAVTILEDALRARGLPRRGGHRRRLVRRLRGLRTSWPT